MAAYHKVEVSLNTNAVEVGIPSPQTVNVVVPTIGPAGPVGSVGPVGPQGPQGVPGTGLEVLTTQGDLLYQGASTGQRLGIGTSGQVLKVANGIPAWGNESGAVTSVNGQTGAVTVAVPSASSTTPAALGTAAVGSASTFARADHVHAMPSAALVGAVTIQNRQTISMNISPATSIGGSWDNDVLLLPASRNSLYFFPASWNSPFVRKIRLPTNNNQTGDIIEFQTNFLPAQTGLEFYIFDPGPGWALQDSWSNATASGVYYQYSVKFVCVNGASASWELQGRQWQITAPQTPSSQGMSGQLAYKDPYLYVCVNQNLWRRVPVAAW
jgi:hypothetical protein